MTFLRGFVETWILASTLYYTLCLSGKPTTSSPLDHLAISSNDRERLSLRGVLVPTPSTVDHVSHVLRLGSGKQMRRVDTRAVVAGVADNGAWGEVADESQVRRTVRKVALTVVLDLSIAPVPSTDPQPAPRSVQGRVLQT